MSHQASTELLWHVFLYGATFVYHTHGTVFTYNRKFRKSTPLSLAGHVLVGLFEVSRYHVRALQGLVVPDAIDLTACLIQVSTGLILNSTLLRGDRYATRASYQVVCLLRSMIGLLAFTLQDAALHRSAVKMIDAFIFTRVNVFLAYKLGLDAIYRDSAIYALGVFLGGLLGTAESELPGGVPAYLLLVGLVILLNRSVSARLDSSPSPSGRGSGMRAQDRLAYLLLKAGFAEIHTIRNNKRNLPELSVNIEDIYIDALKFPRLLKVQANGRLV